MHSVENLLVAATDDDVEISKNAIFALHEIGTKEVLDGAINLSMSVDASDRSTAATILGRIGIPKAFSFPHECFDVLIGMLGDKDAIVIGDVILALYHLDGERSLPHILPFTNHFHPYVRMSVAVNLRLNCDEPKAIEALLQLMTDIDNETRNWATSAIAGNCEHDSDEIRKALEAALYDQYEEVRIEAVCGLALRKDFKSVEYLIPLLDAYPTEENLIEAARSLLGISEEEKVSLETLAQSLRRLFNFRYKQK